MSSDTGPSLSEAWADAKRQISEAWQRGLAEGEARRQARPAPEGAQAAADQLAAALTEVGPRLQEALDTAALGIADALAEARQRLERAEAELRWQVARPRDTDPT